MCGQLPVFVSSPVAHRAKLSFAKLRILWISAPSGNVLSSTGTLQLQLPAGRLPLPVADAHVSTCLGRSLEEVRQTKGM